MQTAGMVLLVCLFIFVLAVVAIGVNSVIDELMELIEKKRGEKALAQYKKREADRINDTKIFKNVEEIRNDFE